MKEFKFISSDSITREDCLRADPLRDFHVWWDDIVEADVTAWRDVLDKARDERPIQEHLEAHPLLLAQCVGGGHGRWVIPQQRLGAEYVTDFVVGERSSIGFEWLAVELESPRAKLFTRAGDPTRQLNHAIRQVTDWRTWLQANQNYAARSRDDQGLGLTDVVAEIPGLILLGRRESTPGTTRARRAQLSRTLGIKIHTYDWLTETAMQRARAMADVDKRARNQHL